MVRTSLRYLVCASGVLASVAVAIPQTRANMIANGGFETGDFSGWTVSSSDVYSHVATGASDGYHPHASGNNFAALGDFSGSGALSQTVATSSGQLYTLTYFLASKGDHDTTFSALWDGVTLSGSELSKPILVLAIYNTPSR